MTSHPEDADDAGGGDGAGGVAGELTRIQRRIQELTDSLWAARRGDELIEGVAALEGLRSSLDALELSMVRELRPRCSCPWAPR